MEIASFEPVIGQTYDITNMSIVLKGVFKGFIQNVRSMDYNGKKVTISRGDRPPLLLFEIVRPPGSKGYRYAGARVDIFHDTLRKRLRFSLVADHFGNTVARLGIGGERPRSYWKKV